jgi:hypothetical protein
VTAAGWKVAIGLGAVAGIALLVLTLGRTHTQAPEANAQPPAAEPAPPATPSFFTRHPREAPPLGATNGGLAGMPAIASELITNWEDKLDQLLAAEGDTSDKARQMLEMFPRLPEAGQVEVAKHLSNLVANEDYAPLGKFLVDPQLPAEALDTLMADALNRPNSLKLPALLEVARTPQHPKAGDAKEILGFFLEGDYGEDWPKWQEKIETWLKENPD